MSEMDIPHRFDTMPIHPSPLFLNSSDCGGLEEGRKKERALPHWAPELKRFAGGWWMIIIFRDNDHDAKCPQHTFLLCNWDFQTEMKKLEPASQPLPPYSLSINPSALLPLPTDLFPVSFSQYHLEKRRE